MKTLSNLMPVLPGVFIPRGNGGPPIPARIESLPYGMALVTIGDNSSPYASAALARTQLEAMEARGTTRLKRAEVRPC